MKSFNKPKPDSMSFYVISTLWLKRRLFSRLLIFSHTTIDKLLQDSTLHYAICCWKHDFCNILLLVLPKPVFCSTTTYEDQNKGNIYRNNRIGLLAGFQLLTDHFCCLNLRWKDKETNCNEELIEEESKTTNQPSHIL